MQTSASVAVSTTTVVLAGANTTGAPGNVLVIGSVSMLSTSARAINSTFPLLVKRDGVTLTQNPLEIKTGSSPDDQKTWNFIYLDKDAPAGSNYSVSATASASVSMEGRIAAITGVNGEMTTQTTPVPIGTGRTLLLQNTTGLGAGNKIILAAVDLLTGNSGGNNFAINTIVLRNATRNLTANQGTVAVTSTNGAKGAYSNYFFIWKETTGSNPYYNITMQSDDVGVNATGTMIVLDEGNMNAIYNQTDGVALSATDLTLAVSANSSYTTGQVFVLASEFITTSSSSARTIPAGNDVIYQNDQTVNVSNALNIRVPESSSNSRGRNFLFMNNYSVTGNDNYTVSARGSASGPKLSTRLLLLNLISSSPTVSVSLVAPTNGQTTYENLTSFNSTATASSNITNATLFVWNSTNYLINQTNLTFEGVTSINPNISVVLPYYDDYLWNYWVCSVDLCSYASSNYTLHYAFLDSYPPAITINSPQNTTYNSTTLNFSLELNENGEWCGFRLDGGDLTSLTNTSLKNFNYTYSGLSQAWHNVTFYCNDTSHNQAQASASFRIKINVAPNLAVLNSPENSSTTGTMYSALLSFNVTDNNDDLMNISIYGSQPAQNITMVLIGDTQLTSQDYPTRLQNMTDWIINNKDKKNIIWVSFLGDLVETCSNMTQWDRINATIKRLEDANISYSLPFGNHDTPCPGTIESYFPLSRVRNSYLISNYTNSSYYNYYIKQSGGVDFLIYSLSYDYELGNVLSWVNQSMITYPSKKSIVFSHKAILDTGGLTDEGIDLWNKALRSSNTTFFTANGHEHASARRNATLPLGREVRGMLLDGVGSSAEVTAMTYDPSTKRIYVETINTRTLVVNTAENKTYSYSYDLQESNTFMKIGEFFNVANGTTLSFNWTQLAPNTTYQWYVNSTDIEGAVNSSPIWRFTTYDGVIPDPIPDFSSYLSNNATLSNEGLATFNVTVNNANGTVIFHILNGTVIDILASNTSNIFNASLLLKGNKTYFYWWTAYGNGSSNYLNNSGLRYYTINYTGGCPSDMSGSNTLASKCQVTTCQQLQDVQTNMTGFYELANDIDCSASSTWNLQQGFLPIGRGFSDRWHGFMDGKNFYVKNIFINRTGQALYAGIFGVMDSDGNITSLNANNAVIFGGNSHTGVILGYSYGNFIHNLSVWNSTINGRSNTGAVIGFCNAWVYESSSINNNVYGTSNVGGLIGFGSSGYSVHNSYAKNIFVNGTSFVGGLVGDSVDGYINNSYSTGFVNGTVNVGGLAGYSDDALISGGIAVQDSWTTAFTIGNSNHSGLIGNSVNGYIFNNSYWLNWTGDNVSQCHGTGESGCTAISQAAGVSYFYTTTNPPMDMWTYPPWSNAYSGTGYPVLWEANYYASFPIITYKDPTPSNGTTITYVNLTINISLVETSPSDFKFNWNGTNFSIFANLSLMMGFNNVSALGENGTWVVDASNNSINGTFNGVKFVQGKYGGAYELDGADDLINISDSDFLSANASGTVTGLTIAFWIKPSTFNFTGTSGDVSAGDAVHPLGKLDNGDMEWQFRLYNSTASTPKRFSFYHYNKSVGSVGVGSFFQDELNEGEWIQVVGVVNETTTAIFKNGQRRDTDLLSGFGISLGNSNARLRIGKKYNGNSFNGSIDEIMIWNRALNDTEINQIYMMTCDKINSTNWEIIANQRENSTQALRNGTYTYYASAKNQQGNEIVTSQRFVNISTVSASTPTNNQINVSLSVSASANNGNKGAFLRGMTSPFSSPAIYSDVMGALRKVSSFFSDILSSLRGVGRNSNQGIIASSISSLQSAFKRIASQAFSHNGVVSRAASFFRNIAQSVKQGVLSNMAAIQNLLQKLFQAIGLGGSYDDKAAYGKAGSQGVTSSSVLQKAAGFPKKLSQSLFLGGTATLKAAYTRLFNIPGTILSSLQRLFTGTRSASEDITLNGGASEVSGFKRTGDQALTLSSMGSRVGGFLRKPLQSISAAGAVTREGIGNYIINLAQKLSLDGTVKRTAGFFLNLFQGFFHRVVCLFNGSACTASETIITPAGGGSGTTPSGGISNITNGTLSTLDVDYSSTWFYDSYQNVTVTALTSTGKAIDVSSITIVLINYSDSTYDIRHISIGVYQKAFFASPHYPQAIAVNITAINGNIKASRMLLIEMQNKTAGNEFLAAYKDFARDGNLLKLIGKRNAIIITIILLVIFAGIAVLFISVFKLRKRNRQK